MAALPGDLPPWQTCTPTFVARVKMALGLPFMTISGNGYASSKTVVPRRQRL
jgi:hypothetical protein